jgi:hypothetical protein
MKRIMSQSGLLLCWGLFGLACAFGAPTTTTFSLNTGVAGVTTGTLSNGQGGLSSISDLTGGGTTRSYAAQSFTPTVTGTYTFGVGSATFDAVLVLYNGTFTASTPGANAIAVNDDSDGQPPSGSTVTIPGCAGTPGLCPKLTATLTANTTYTVVVTTFGGSPGFSVVPVDFYVYGEPVAVGAPSHPVPIPTLGEWGMIGLAGLLVLFAWQRLRTPDSAGVA